MSVSAILISGGVVYVIGESTNGNFASRFWTQNTRRTIGCVQALFPLPPPPPPPRPPPRERACSQAMSVCLSPCLPVCLSICLSVCLSVYLSVCLLSLSFVVYLHCTCASFKCLYHWVCDLRIHLGLFLLYLVVFRACILVIILQDNYFVEI